ncbi:MAG: glycosyl transferase [Oscillospiraceae bacterium]|nr:glycosyl transferase [Oscillospiraceae bacterium]
MSFTKETSRSAARDAIKTAAEVFGNRLHGYTDALFRDSTGTRVIAFTGLGFYAPVLVHVINDPLLFGILESRDGDVLIDGKDLSVYSGSDPIDIDGEARERIAALKDTVLRSPGELNDSGELIMDLRSYRVGSHYGVNLLLGNRSEYADCLQSTPKSVLDEFGRGSFRGMREKQVLATRYVLSPEENGEPANRQFYITENGKQIFYSLNVKDNVKSAYCHHSQNRTVITYETECGLRIIRTIFLLPQEAGEPSAVEAQRIQIINLTDTPRDLRIVVTGMFGITDPGTLAGDIIYANVVTESQLYMKDGRPVAVAVHHQPKDCDTEKRFAMILCGGETMDEYCSSLYDFMGSGSLDRPEMIARLSNSHSRRQAAFFAMAKSFRLDKEITADCFVGMDDGLSSPEDFEPHLANLYNRYRDPAALEKTLEAVIEDNEHYCSFIRMQNGDPVADPYISKNLPFQVLYQSFVSRSFAWTQKSYRETGFREIQDLFASMYYMHANGQDELIKRLLSSWAENVFEFGYAYHNFTVRGKEPGMCSDDQLWLVQAVYRYFRLSGDTGFLKAEIPVAGTDRTRPLHKTLESIITYSGKISVGRHGLPLLDKADWNDCLRLDTDTLEGPEKEALYRRQLEEKGQKFGAALENDQSESVMNACLLKIAADEVSEMAGALGENDLMLYAKEISDAVKESVNRNAWIGGYYARCLINDGRGYSYLGSTGDSLSLDKNIDGTYYLNSFSWALLAGIADDEKTRDMLDIIDRYLKTDAGLKLVTPVDYDKLGIVTGSSFYFPGDRENGGVFKHAAMMCTVACLRRAKETEDPDLAKRLRDLAFFMIDRTLPYKTLENPYVLKGNPRFCTQYNNSETGEGIGPILSGTASWLTLAVYEILGLDFDGDSIYPDPILNSGTCRYELNIQDTSLAVDINALNGFRRNKDSRVLFDGTETSGKIVLPRDGKHHKLEVIL